VYRAPERFDPNPTLEYVGIMSSAVVHLFLLIVATSLFSGSAALKLHCYQCGVGLSQSCEVFEEAIANNGSLQSFHVPCRDNEICYKSAYHLEDEKRGCTTLKMVEGEECDGMICVCNTDLCNSSSSHSYSAVMFILTLLAGVYSM